MMGRSTGCSAHRTALAAFVERSERGPATYVAFEHLDRCRRCQAELTELLLTVHAVRRTLAAAGTVDPPPDAWVRLRSRVQGPVANAWGMRSTLASAVVGAGLVAALIGPTAVLPPADAVGREPGPAPAVLRERTAADERAESAFLSRARPERPHSLVVPDVAVTAAWPGPDGLGRAAASIRAEVPPERAD
jgi:hypothetical protein